MNAIKEYDAYLTFPTISNELQSAIRHRMEKRGLDIDVYENALEFTYSGRDFNDQIIEAFIEIAGLLREASGEIQCEVDEDEQPDPTFKFYTISNAQLWLQLGKIVRSEQKTIVTSARMA
jgi:hypothetical protein